MAMANLISTTSPITLTPKPKPANRFSSPSKTCFYSPPPPTSSFPFPPSHSVHVVAPVSALFKEKSGFVRNLNWRDCFGSNAPSFGDDSVGKDNKFQCHWKRTDAVADAEEDTQSTESKINESKRKSGRKLRPKLYAIIVGASFCVVVGLCSLKLPKLHTPRPTVVPYSDLLGGIRDGRVIRVQFAEDSRQIYFNTKSSDDQIAQTPQTDSLARGFNGDAKISLPRWSYCTRNVGDDKYEILRMLKEKGITYGSDRGLLSASTKNSLLIFFQVTPFWIMVLLTCYQLNAQFSLGKTTKRKPSKKQSVTFDDVEGVDAAKAELLEIVLCMKGDGKYKKLGAKLPRGVLLAGPPGTGKTLLARAVAGEAGVSFFSISASELVEVFVGRGAARVRDLFREARKNSPSIIFIDEIDAVGGQRGRTLNCERDQTLNQLLTDMDGFEKDESVVVIAATNRPETLDSALMRPGRFSRKVRVDAPDENGRRKIFALYLRDVPMQQEDKEAICNLVASRTPGLVGADLENIAHESVLLAARRGGEFVTKEDIIAAVERATSKVYGEENKSKPFFYRPTTQEGGSMGFGYSG